MESRENPIFTIFTIFTIKLYIYIRVFIMVSPITNNIYIYNIFNPKKAVKW